MVDYQGPSFPPKPTQRLPAAYNVEPLTMTADELDKKLKENLEQKAMEWYTQLAILQQQLDNVVFQDSPRVVGKVGS